MGKLKSKISPKYQNILAVIGIIVGAITICAFLWAGFKKISSATTTIENTKQALSKHSQNLDRFLQDQYHPPGSVSKIYSDSSIEYRDGVLKYIPFK